MSTKHAAWLGFVLVTFILFAAAPCLAHNGSRDIGTTVRDLGRGGAFIATDPDVGSLQGNPAALAFLEQPELYLDLRFLQTQVEYSGLLEADGNTSHNMIGNVGYAEPVSDRLAWGVGVFTLTTLAYSLDGFKLDRAFPGVPEGVTGVASTRVRYLTLTPGIAYRLSDDTAIGASLNYSSGKSDEEAANQFGNATGYRLYGLHGEGYSLRLGMYHRNEDTTLGAYWRSRSFLDVSDANVQTGPLNPVPNTVIHGVSVTGGNFPEEYGVGIGQKLNSRLTAFGEYRRYNWSKVRKVILIELPQGEPIANPQYWEDQDVYVLGAEYKPDCTDREVWRLGLNYAKSCIPRTYLSPMYPAITEWHYTAGYERELHDGLVLSTALVYAAPNKEQTPADSPFNNIYGGGQPYSTGSQSLQFGLGLTWKLGHAGKRPCAETPGPECEPGAPAPVAVDAEGNQTYAALLGKK